MKTDNARYKHVGDVLVVRSAGDAGGESRGAGQDLGGGVQNLEGCKKINSPKHIIEYRQHNLKLFNRNFVNSNSQNMDEFNGP